MSKHQIEFKTLINLIDFIYEDITPVIYTHYSEFDHEIVDFHNSTTFLNHITNEKNQKVSHIGYAIHYPDMRGYIEKQRVDLDPKACKGHTFRYCIRGWGLIFLNCNFNDSKFIECDLNVNSKKRAELWFETIHELKDPSLWNWPIVEKHYKRLNYFLKKHANS